MDLSTTYLGMKLRSPLVPSAAQPLTENVDNIKRMEDAGASREPGSGSAAGAAPYDQRPKSK